MNWPVTVGERNIDYLLPEFWRASNADDLKLMRALSRPEGIMERIEKKLGFPFADGYAESIRADEIRTAFTIEILQTYKPAFMATHLIALDGIQHEDGPYTTHVYATLEAIDKMVGDLVAAARAAHPDAVVAVVSDHGFITTHTVVHLRTALVDAGLIKLKEPLPQHATPTIESWEAQVWPGGGSAAIVLRDSKNDTLRAKVDGLLTFLQSDKRNGIARVFTKKEITALSAYTGADFVVEFEPGYYLGYALKGNLTEPAPSKGMHGYFPERPEMHASFFIKGKGIAQRKDLGVIDMRRIAPTIADLLKIDFPQKEAALDVAPRASR